MSKNSTGPVTEIAEGLNVRIGNFTAPIVFIRTPATERGGKQIPERIQLRMAALGAADTVAFVTAAVGEVLAKGGEEAVAEWFERVFKSFLLSTAEDAVVVGNDGQPAFDDGVYSTRLVEKARRKSGPTKDSLAAEHQLLLEQIVAISEIRDDWATLALGLPEDKATGEIIGHPYDAAKWAEVCDALNSNPRLNLKVSWRSFTELVTFSAGLKQRRIDIERQLAEKDAVAQKAAAKRAAKKNAEAPAPVV